MTEIALPRADLAPHRRPRVGYAMTLTAATLVAVNGAVSKVILDTGISSLRLSELRATAGTLGLAAGLAVLAPTRLRLSWRELPFLIFYGVCGFALVQWLYFVAIHRLPIGIGLLLEFTAPVLVALWARFVWRERVRRRVWTALALSLAGLVLVAEVWSGFSLDGVGVAAGLVDAVALAVYFLLGERGVGRRAPFALSIGALRHLPATTVGIVATFEPLAASVVAWVWLGESLDAAQLIGGLIVLAGIVLAETSR